MKKQLKKPFIHLSLAHTVCFRVNDALREELNQIPELSRFIREAIIEKLQKEQAE